MYEHKIHWIYFVLKTHVPFSVWNAALTRILLILRYIVYKIKLLIINMFILDDVTLKDIIPYDSLKQEYGDELEKIYYL